jgi:lipoate-protein ligase B
MPSDDARCQVQRLGLVAYQRAWELQHRLVGACRTDGLARLLLLEHPPTYTLGVRGKQEHLLLDEGALARLGASAVRVDRGGDVTFHGPGQLVGYPILDLSRWGEGPLWYVRALEAVLIEALAAFGVAAERSPGRPGVWAGGAKIASIGVHVSRGVTSHGFALNVDPDLRYFRHIVPCGLPDVSVTSMANILQARRAEGRPVQDKEVPRVLPDARMTPVPAAAHCAATDDRMPPTSVGGVQPALSMTQVMDAIVQSFADIFELEMLDGDRIVAPAAWAPSAAR